ncbi:MAG: response regulator [Candidatus Riflebacteria bacterium]|nr:response regulator [Candidatus Riflebacteria bacterium]
MSKKILIVDDSPSIRQMVGNTLREAGYEVVEAADGKEALNKLRTDPVDAAITDINMPDLNGIDLIREIRNFPGLRFIPIIVLTTEFSNEKKLEGKNAGATGWIVKPFKSEQLLTVIRKVLG